ncbi:E3 ubiquitin- ligase RNF8-A-like [Pelobates cultripes]|uniref:E3 ubiquitin-protein ligase RNF182 n=1 Tax=Pelobates cultripes TaxID=61616 RepID=A0AAD1T5D0_PELCU|nr:E3 ubiquitin- ligase RNF8-A-like [Pelobates cultripes]
MDHPLDPHRDSGFQEDRCGLTQGPAFSGASCPVCVDEPIDKESDDLSLAGQLAFDPLRVPVGDGKIQLPSGLITERNKDPSYDPYVVDITGGETVMYGQKDAALAASGVHPDLSLLSKATDQKGGSSPISSPEPLKAVVLAGNVGNAEDGSLIPLLARSESRQECPICTEFYDAHEHQRAELHCNHLICDSCVSSIMTLTGHGNVGRISCPICRQQTPMLKFEVRRMQEQMMENIARCNESVRVELDVPTRTPGLCSALEYRFQTRFRNNPRFIFPPCFRYSQGFIEFTFRLKQRSPCAYRTLLFVLLIAEFASFFIIFLPIIILALLIIFLK